MRALFLPRRLIGLGLLVVVLVFAFIEAGFWQLRRLDEKRHYNQHFIARDHQPEESIISLFPTLPTTNATRDAIAYRRATATGRFDTAHEIVLLSRSFQGISGHHVLTPLIVGNDALLVDRGWVPEADHDPPVEAAAPPSGAVTVHGILFPSQHRGLFGPKEPPAGPLTQMFRVEITRIQRQLPYPVYPLYMQLLSQSPAPGDLPKIDAELLTLDEGPHLSYAMQWFFFAAIAIATYIAIIVKTKRTTARPQAGTYVEERQPTR